MVLFFFFGFKLLKQGWETDPVPKKNEELEEVEEELERSEHEEANPSTLEGGAAKQQNWQNRAHRFFVSDSLICISIRTFTSIHY